MFHRATSTIAAACFFLLSPACQSDDGTPATPGDAGATSSGGVAGVGGSGGSAGGGFSASGGRGGTGNVPVAGSAGTGGASAGAGGKGASAGMGGNAASAGTSGNGASAGTGTGGNGASAGTGTGGNAASAGTGTGGNAASGGTGGNGTGGVWSCPAGPFGSPVPAAPAFTQVAGVPPAGFGTGNGSNVEGAVWLDGSLYVSHIQEGVPNPPPARILKITGTTVEEFLLDSGSNGLCLAGDGRLIAARHTTGSLSYLDLATKTFTPFVENYMGERFDSPNDVTRRNDGNVYFTDPDYQAPADRPQAATRVYRIAPSGTVSIVDATLNQPNGVSLSPDQNTLYVASTRGVFSYPVAADGTVGTSTSFSNQSSDGMAVDCAGNLYLTSGRNIVILSATGSPVATLTNAVPAMSSTTNVAFGGPTQRRLFITARQNAGLWYVDLDVPGAPY